MDKKLYKLKYALYHNEESGEVSDCKLDENWILFAKKGELAELEELSEDDWYYYDGIPMKYHFNFVAKGGKYIYSGVGINDHWFEEVVRCKKKK